MTIPMIEAASAAAQCSMTSPANSSDRCDQRRHTRCAKPRTGIAASAVGKRLLATPVITGWSDPRNGAGRDARYSHEGEEQEAARAAERQADAERPRRGQLRPADVSHAFMTPVTRAPARSLLARAMQWPTDVQRAYAAGEERPLKGYLQLLSIYALGTVGAAGIAKLRHVSAPARVGIGDLMLVGISTHKLSRMIAKDPVLSPFRAPFTRFKGQSGEAELAEEVRGHGLQHAAGELVTCPFCLGQWVATALMVGLVLIPRQTRLMAATVTAKAISDTAQLLYDAAQKGTQALPSSGDQDG